MLISGGETTITLKGNGKGNAKLTYKVSGKGAVSVYGMGRFPVTLYAEQWERLFIVATKQVRGGHLRDAVRCCNDEAWEFFMTGVGDNEAAPTPDGN